MKLTEDDRKYIASLLKQFDGDGKLEVPLPELGKEEDAETSRPWLYLILRGYARYARDSLMENKLALELTLLGREALRQAE